MSKTVEEIDMKSNYEMAAISLLSDRIKMEKSKTGLYNISVWMEEKYLASDIANMIYDVLIDLIFRNFFSLTSHIITR